MTVTSLPQSPESENFQQRSSDSLSSGIHLTVASDDTMSMSPETEKQPGLSAPPAQPPTQPAGQAQDKDEGLGSAEDPSQPSQLSGLLCGSLRFPSLPDSLEAPSSPAEIQRHVSDPVLPAS